MAEGSEVDLSLKAGALVVRPVRRKRHSLADLVKRITAANSHVSIATGTAVGREVW